MQSMDKIEHKLAEILVLKTCFHRCENSLTSVPGQKTYRAAIAAKKHYEDH